MRFPELFRATLAFKQDKVDTLEVFKQFKKNYENATKEEIRTHYNYVWETLINKQQEINQAHEEVGGLIQAFEECGLILDEMYKVSEDIKLIINRAQVGTLEGLSRQTITESDIVPDTFMQTQVLEGLPSGGKGVSKKRHNRSNKKTKRKRVKIQNL